MDFSAYKKARQREYVIIALEAALHSITGPTPTIEIVEMVRTSLAAKHDQKVSIGRILCEFAPYVPEAQRGEVFKSYGRMVQRWVWWPKGTSPQGMTRQAARDSQTPLERLNGMPRETAAEIESYLRALRAYNDCDKEPWSV